MSNPIKDKLMQLREAAAKRRAHAPEPYKAKTFGERMADAVAEHIGSWSFVIIQSVLLIGWIIFNIFSSRRVDPYPFILLNLLLSFQAAYTAPIIMMSQNRQGDSDRERAIQDFDVNTKAEIEIETLHTKIDMMREQEIARLADAVDRLTKLLEARS
jgi:uncharacterized membrane protein